jgi:hypothetical protein
MTAMHSDARRPHALRQALVLLVVIASVVAAALIAKQRPAGHDELKISLSDLRSQAAEVELLLTEGGSALPPRVVRAQAAQLLKAIDRSREELDGLRLTSELAMPREQARPLAAQAAATLRALTQTGAPAAPASVEAARRTRHSLEAIEQSLP